jgi:hypothetical protein
MIKLAKGQDVSVKSTSTNKQTNKQKKTLLLRYTDSDYLFGIFKHFTGQSVSVVNCFDVIEIMRRGRSKRADDTMTKRKMDKE